MTPSDEAAAWAQKQQQNEQRYQQEQRNYNNTPPGWHITAPPTR